MNLQQPSLEIFQDKIVIKHIITDDGHWYEHISNANVVFCSRASVIGYLKENFGLNDKTIKHIMDNIVEEDRSSLPF